MTSDAFPENFEVKTWFKRRQEVKGIRLSFVEVGEQTKARKLWSNRRKRGSRFAKWLGLLLGNCPKPRGSVSHFKNSYHFFYFFLECHNVFCQSVSIDFIDPKISYLVRIACDSSTRKWIWLNLSRAFFICCDEIALSFENIVILFICTS